MRRPSTLSGFGNRIDEFGFTEKKDRIMDNPNYEKIFHQIDTTASMRRGDPYFNDIEKEIIRSHDMSLKISAKRPTDPDYKDLLEELFRHEIDKSVSIVSPFYCDCGCRLTIGRNSIINKGATIFSAGRVEIGESVLIGPDVKILTVNHDLYDRMDHILFKKVVVEDNAWICAGAIICPGVTIGKNAVVGAGAVVTKDVPDNTVVGGNPAKVIKKL